MGQHKHNPTAIAAKNGKLCGDCFNFSKEYEYLKVTPVPNGVGLMTRAMLMAHVAGLEV